MKRLSWQFINAAILKPSSGANKRQQTGGRSWEGIFLAPLLCYYFLLHCARRVLVVACPCGFGAGRVHRYIFVVRTHVSMYFCGVESVLSSYLLCRIRGACISVCRIRCAFMSGVHSHLVFVSVVQNPYYLTSVVKGLNVCCSESIRSSWLWGRILGCLPTSGWNQSFIIFVVSHLIHLHMQALRLLSHRNRQNPTTPIQNWMGFPKWIWKLSRMTRFSLKTG